MVGIELERKGSELRTKCKGSEPKGMVRNGTEWQVSEPNGKARNQKAGPRKAELGTVRKSLEPNGTYRKGSKANQTAWLGTEQKGSEHTERLVARNRMVPNGKAWNRKETERL